MIILGANAAAMAAVKIANALNGPDNPGHILTCSDTQNVQ